MGHPSDVKELLTQEKLNGYLREMKSIISARAQEELLAREAFKNSLDTMWNIFIRVVHVEDAETIEQFISAKDRAHELLSKIAGKEE